MNPAQSVIYLSSCALNNQTPDPALIQKMDLDAVYTFARKHMISAIVAMALESACFKDERSENAIGKAVRKAVIFQNALQEISTQMEKEQIWHVPLKGSVIKEYYPRFGMREMSDIDILIDPDRVEDVKKIMEDLGSRRLHSDPIRMMCTIKNLF
ncbi:MAG: nucleotidyltransferase family protein [Firmicutes bacterium]|nr:nucleotidyltransferase family protein [Bacillota bacterium]